SGQNQAQVSLTVQVRTKDGSLMAEFRSAEFTLNPGNTDLTLASPVMVSSSYPNSGFREYEQKNASFPSGNYQYCAELVSRTSGETAKQCTDFELQGLNPATLVYPEHQSYLEEPGMIQFSWVPCTPP